MIEAAVDGLGDPSGVLVVTVLTSLEPDDLVETGVAADVGAQVSRIASLAHRAGAGGVICPPNEVRAAKLAGPGLTIVTPGIRGAGSHHDQRLVAAPRDALEAGADYLVIGRAVTAHPRPIEALETLLSGS
jgi:orotidine-5'-phosphate decarboxylase